MHVNSVLLRGRLSMEAEHRELPSGVVLTRWRLAVRRPDDHPGHQRADAIECATFEDDVRETVSGWMLDDVVEVEGAVRRRWWRGGSRYEVEVRTARLVERGGSVRRPRRAADQRGRPEVSQGTGDAVAAAPGSPPAFAASTAAPASPAARVVPSPGSPPEEPPRVSLAIPETPGAADSPLARSVPSPTGEDGRIDIGPGESTPAHVSRAEGARMGPGRADSGRAESGRAESGHGEDKRARPRRGVSLSLVEGGQSVAKTRITNPVRGLGLNEVDFLGTRSPRAATASASSVASGLSRTAVPDSCRASRTAA